MSSLCATAWDNSSATLQDCDSKFDLVCPPLAPLAVRKTGTEKKVPPQLTSNEREIENGTNGNSGTDGRFSVFSVVPLFPFVPFSIFDLRNDLHG